MIENSLDSASRTAAISRGWSLHRTRPQCGAILFGGVILSADCTMGAGAVFASIHATVSGAVSVYLASAVISGKRAGNAGAVQDQSHSCHEQDQCNYWKFVHHLSSTFVSTLTLQNIQTPLFLFIFHCPTITNKQTQLFIVDGSICMTFEVEK